MKARHIKALRKKVLAYKPFIVIVSLGLFGEFNDYFDKCTVEALNPQHAIKKYLRRWYRKTREKHKFDKKEFVECAYMWGKFKVIDNKGYKTYWM